MQAEAHTAEQKVSFWQTARFARFEVFRWRKGGLPSILQRQRINFRRLLRHAYENVPFYRRLYGRINPDRVRLGDLPPVTKSQLMSEFSDTLVERGITIDEVKEFASRLDLIGRLFRGKYIVLHTSGSTGERGYFLNDIPSWQRAHALGLVRQKRMKPAPLSYIAAATPFHKVRAALVIPTGGHFGTLLVPKIAAPITRYFAELYDIDILRPGDEIIAELNEVKPHHIHTYPTIAQLLAESYEAGKLKFKPCSLSVSSEPFLPSIKDRVIRAFGPIPIYEFYASTEFLHMARSCALDRLHLSIDWVIVEPVTEDGRPVPIGEQGDKVFITSLYNYFQPLIRYEMTDVVRILPEPCECGEPLPVIEVFGRTNDILTMVSPEGKRIKLLPTPILVSFLEVPNLKKYQIVHERQNFLRVRYIPEQDASSEMVEQAIVKLMKGYLKRHGVGDWVEIVPELVDDIPRDPVSHKVKQIIDMTNG